MTDSVLTVDSERKTAGAKKGPLVWLNMDQAELDAAYDQSKYAPNQALVQARRLVLSQRARAALWHAGRRPCRRRGCAPSRSSQGGGRWSSPNRGSPRPGRGPQ